MRPDKGLLRLNMKEIKHHNEIDLWVFCSWGGYLPASNCIGWNWAQVDKVVMGWVLCKHPASYYCIRALYASLIHIWYSRPIWGCSTHGIKSYASCTPEKYRYVMLISFKVYSFKCLWCFCHLCNKHSNFVAGITSSCCSAFWRCCYVNKPFHIFNFLEQKNVRMMCGK
jgi:hypothetical protein